MRAPAYICFFLSGFSSLVLQLVWTRLFALVFGSTTLAISAVVGAFMGGLAFGAWLAGRLSDRLRAPIVAYAIAEAAVGVYALILPQLVDLLPALNKVTHAATGGSFAALTAIRFVASIGILGLPTALMGATLPLLSMHLVRDQHDRAAADRLLGYLYAVNTAGATLGALIAGCALLPRLGLVATSAIAATTNILLAGVVALARRWLVVTPERSALISAGLYAGQRSSCEDTTLSRSTCRALLFSFALSGAAAMIHQVLWTRALSMVLGSSTYSFTLVLSSFLVGIAVGAAVGAQVSRRHSQALLALAATHAAVFCLAAVVYCSFNLLGVAYVDLLSRSGGANAILTAQALVTAGVILPATVAMGAIFPLTIRCIALTPDSIGRTVGTAYAANTIGAIVGALSGGFVLLPVLQLRGAGIVAVALSLVSATLLYLLACWPVRITKAIVYGAVAMVPFVALGRLRYDPARVSYGVFRPSIAADLIGRAASQWPTPEVLFYRDGISTTVSVERWSGKHLALKSNGKVDASTGDDMPTQITVGMLPILLHPDAPRFHPSVALVGLASGVTAGAILQFPVADLTVVELEPAMVAASRWFDSVNHRPLSDARTRVVFDDGRNFLATTSDKYDVIINEPSNPWVSGVSNLFTKEYFLLAKARLASRGVFCSWVQMYELSPRRLKAIYRSFAAVFPYAYAFAAEPHSTDTLLIGGHQPLDLNIARLRHAYADLRVRRELERAGHTYPDDLLALLLLKPSDFGAFTAGVPHSTDDNGLLEFHAPIDLYNHRQFGEVSRHIYGLNWPYGRISATNFGYDGSDDEAHLVYSWLRAGALRFVEATPVTSHRARSERAVRVRELVSLLYRPATPSIRDQVLMRIADADQMEQQAPGVSAALFRRFYRRARLGASCAALELTDDWPPEYLQRVRPLLRVALAALAVECRRYDQAMQYLMLLTESGHPPVTTDIHYLRGVAEYETGNYKAGIEQLERWLTLNEGPPERAQSPDG